MEEEPARGRGRGVVSFLFVRFKLHPWLILAAVFALCVALIGGVALFRAKRRSSTADLISSLPPGESVLLYVDFQALRQAGIIDLFAGSKVAQEPEYRAFVEQSGFDYQEDLDSALVSFRGESVYFLLRGRFDWEVLNAYVTRQGGVCRNTYCRVAGSAPERKISFFPLRSTIMAMAVGNDEWAAASIRAGNRDASQFRVPGRPVWLFVPASALAAGDKLPAGTRLFARALGGAEQTFISLGPQGDGFEAVLDVTCKSPQEASALVAQLEGITAVLRAMLAREKQKPNPRDLSGALAAGSFRAEDRKVFGRWPIERALLENLAGGSF